MSADAVVAAPDPRRPPDDAVNLHALLVQRGNGDLEAGACRLVAENIHLINSAADETAITESLIAAFEYAGHADPRSAAATAFVLGKLAADCEMQDRQEEAEAHEPVDDNVEPLDLFGDATLAGSPDLPRDALPGVIADFAWDEAERLGVDPALIALPSLVVCAAAIDDAFVIQPKARDTGWVESARLWLGVVTEPGGRKSPALQKVTAPLRAAEQRWLQPDREALAQWKKEKDPGDKPRPRQRRLIVDDATVEALSDILVDNSRGVLCYRDELSAWFGSFNAYKRGGSDRSQWLELYNGGGKPVDRVLRGNLYVPNWSACLLGGIQPGPMRRLASKIDDDGLIQRFVVIFPRADYVENDRVPDYAAIGRYRETVVHLIDLDSPQSKPVVFRLSPEAQAERALVERIPRNVMMLPDTSAAFRAHLGKWPGLFARLLCTYHVTEAAADRIWPPETVSGATAARVAALMVDYLLPHAARFYSELLGQEHLTHARWLAGHILAHQLERITARDVGRVYGELRGDGNRIADVMATLVLAGWATEIDTGRRPATKWKVNPRVHRRFAKRAAEERQRREAVRAQIARAAQELGTGGDA